MGGGGPVKQTAPFFALRPPPSPLITCLRKRKKTVFGALFAASLFGAAEQKQTCVRRRVLGHIRRSGQLWEGSSLRPREKEKYFVRMVPASFFLSFCLSFCLPPPFFLLFSFILPFFLHFCIFLFFLSFFALSLFPSLPSSLFSRRIAMPF